MSLHTMRYYNDAGRYMSWTRYDYHAALRWIKNGNEIRISDKKINSERLLFDYDLFYKGDKNDQQTNT